MEEKRNFFKFWNMKVSKCPTDTLEMLNDRELGKGQNWPHRWIMWVCFTFFVYDPVCG